MNDGADPTEEQLTKAKKDQTGRRVVRDPQVSFES